MDEPVHDGDLQRIQDHSHFPSESRCRVSTSSRSPSPRQTERSTRLTLRPRSASPTAGAGPYKFWRSLSQVLQVARLRENTAQAKSVPLFSGDPARNFRMVAQGLLSQGILFLLVRCADVMREVAVGSTSSAGQARRQGAAVSHSLFGFILGPLQLEDARVSPIRDLGRNQQVVAPEAVRRLPLPGGVAVDAGVERADRGW